MRFLEIKVIGLERWSGYIKIASELASLLYKVSLGFGALVTTAYLFSINFYPVGVTFGEAVFLGFVAIFAGFVCTVIFAYGVFSSIFLVWIIHPLSRAIKGCVRFKKRFVFLKNKKNNNYYGVFWYCVKGFFTDLKRVKIKHSLPSYFNSFELILASVILLIFAALLVCIAENKPVIGLVVWAVGGGAIFCFFMSLDERQKSTPSSVLFENKKRSITYKFLAIFVPFFMILANGGIGTISQFVFDGFGIKDKNVMISMEKSEFHKIGGAFKELYCDGLGVVDFYDDVVFIRSVDILWSGVGERALISIPGDVIDNYCWVELFAGYRKGGVDLVFRLDDEKLNIIRALK